MPAIVVDAGGTNLRLAVASDDGELQHIAREPIANYLRQRYEKIWDAIADAIARYCSFADSLGETGDLLIVAVPGPVADNSRLIAAPTIDGRRRHVPDLYTNLSEKTNRRIYLLNDVSAAAWCLSERAPYSRFIVVTVSSGIGSKVVDRVHPARVLDNDPFAGEIGHLVIDASVNAPRCDCGGRGHLGAISSARGTLRLARKTAAEHPQRFADSLLFRTFRIDPRRMTNEDHLVPAALLGDPWALDVITRAAEPLARVLASTIIGAGLERAVVMGGFAQQLGSTYRAILDAHLARLIEDSGFPFPRRTFVDVMDKAEEPGLAGGAALFANRCFVTP
jgi:C7-cyclitol 7-kinase